MQAVEEQIENGKYGGHVYEEEEEEVVPKEAGGAMKESDGMYCVVEAAGPQK
jgi:hypothetical protein